MNPLRKYSSYGGRCAIVAGVISLATPRAIHAVAAALVRDVDNPARQPFPRHLPVKQPGQLLLCPGHRALWARVGDPRRHFDVLVNPGPGSSVRCMLQAYGGTPYRTFSYTLGAQDLGPALGFTDGTEEYTCVLNFPVYVDPGMTVDAGFARGFVEPDSWQFVASLSGYTVSLP